MTILDEINNYKKIEVAYRKELVSIDDLSRFPQFDKSTPSFSRALTKKGSGIIAEHKRMSPSKGVINSRVNTQEVVLGYQNAGASAVSVLTDHNYFGGTIYDLMRAKEVLKIPILRKDFIIDEYQLYEAKALGASVILLIAASLDKKQCAQLAKKAQSLGLEVLMEVHNEEELDLANPFINVIGVNNRNLKTFDVDVNTSVALFEKIPNDFIKISESGISSVDTVNDLKKVGFQGFLMGENFMKTEYPGKSCAQFIQTMNA